MVASSELLEFSRILERVASFTLSPQGKEKILSTQKLNYNDLIEELRFLDAFYKEMAFRPFPIFYYPDLRLYLEKTKNNIGFLESTDFLQIIVFIEAVLEFKKYVKESENPLLRSLAEFFPSFLEETRKQWKMIFDADGNIRDDASQELKIIRNQLFETQTRIEKKLKEILYHPEKSRYLQEHLMTIKEERWVIPLKRECKGKIKGLIISISGSGETLFIEPENIIEDNNRYRELKGEEKLEIIRILKKQTELFSSRRQEWENIYHTALKIECLYAKTAYAMQTKSIFPQINQDGIFILKDARHPLIKNPTPITIELGKDFDILILTGPNTGGKTAAMKTLGLLTQMACSGFFIPAAEGSQVSWVEDILMDIGDEQSLSGNLSAFSAHIKNIQVILEKAGKKSLVLIDELGSATDPNDGSALALAITEAILETQAKAMITCHLEKIKNLAFQNPRIQNATVEFDLETMTPHYRLKIGMTGKSYGLEMAEKLGLSSRIIEKARQYLDKKNTEEEIEKIMESLNKERERARQEREKYEELCEENRKKMTELLQKEKEIKKITAELKKKEGGAILEEIKTIRKKLIHLIEKAKNYKDLEELREKARELEELSFETKQTIKETLPEPHFSHQVVSISDLSVGEIVFLPHFQKEAKILEIQKEKNLLTVFLGNIKMKVPVSEVTKVEKQNSFIESTENKSLLPNLSTPFELNIIGKRREEALREVENYIYSLYAKKMREGIIIHGKGSGILKEMTREVLKSHSFVESFKTSTDGGATIFYLK